MTPVSNGQGRTTCSYFYPDGKSILYASTFRAVGGMPARSPASSTGTCGRCTPATTSTAPTRTGPASGRSRPRPGYDAEATIARDGRIVFTSVRDGDMEIYSMAGDGSDVRRLTRRPGPDGGPFFSADGSQIVFRGRPDREGKELEDYRALLKKELWRPTRLEIYVMNRDGSDLRQVTKLGAASFAPFFTPDGGRSSSRPTSATRSSATSISTW